MRLRTLGRTGLAVSEIGFGCGPTAALMIEGSAAQRGEAVARALDLGINYFDTAPGYANTLSETHLGTALHDLRARPVIATKVALSIGDLGDVERAIRTSVEQSLERLRVDEIALLQLHNRIGARRAAKGELGNAAVLAVEDVLGAGGVGSAFKRLQERGLVRFFGCSAFGGEMSVVQQVIDSGVFDVLSVHYSLLNDSAWSARAQGDERNYAGIAVRAAAQNLGMVALRVLEGGVLTGADVSSAVRRLHCLLQAADISLPEAAIRFALSNPQIGVTLLGLSSIEQIEQACACASRGALPGEVLDSIAGMKGE